MGYTAHMYPNPTDPDVPYSDMFEILSEDDDVVVNDFECREHPEVPLTIEQRDATLNRLGYTRIGPWVDEGDGCAAAPVEPLPWLVEYQAAVEAGRQLQETMRRLRREKAARRRRRRESTEE